MSANGTPAAAVKHYDRSTAVRSVHLRVTGILFSFALSAYIGTELMRGRGFRGEPAATIKVEEWNVTAYTRIK